MRWVGDLRLEYFINPPDIFDPFQFLPINEVLFLFYILVFQVAKTTYRDQVFYLIIFQFQYHGDKYWDLEYSVILFLSPQTVDLLTILSNQHYEADN